jgi:hypothetical protein
MYELKKIRKLFTSKFVGTGPSSCNRRIKRAAVSQKLRNTGLYNGGSLEITEVGSSSPYERLSASLEELCYMKLIVIT